MPPRKKPTLADRVNNEPVRYSLNCGRIALRPADNEVVQTGAGRFDRVNVEPVELVREGAYRDELFTRVYDPADPRDAEFIEYVDAFLEANPHFATDVRLGVRKYGVNEPIVPFPNYDNASPEAIVSAVENMGHPLERIMKYELSKDEPREDVIEALNALDAKQKRSQKSASDEKVEL